MERGKILQYPASYLLSIGRTHTDNGETTNADHHVESNRQKHIENMEPMNSEQTVLKLFDVEGLKFGKFTMRNGELSPVYIDMRVIWTYPNIVVSVAELIWKTIKEANLKFDLLCGLPYQGVPIATYLSTKYNIPMLLKRKEPKTYGTCKFLEGHYNEGDRVLLIDDVVMTGGTLVDDVPIFRREGLEVVGCAAFIDRYQGGVPRIKHLCGIDTLCVVNLPDVLDTLHKNDKLTSSHRETTMEYLQKNRFDGEDYGVKT